MLTHPLEQKGTAIAAGTTTTIKCDPSAVKHQIKINKDGGTSGTLALTAKTRGADTAEVVYDHNRSALVYDLASSTSESYIIEGNFDELIITPTALNGTYKYAYVGW